MYVYTPCKMSSRSFQSFLFVIHHDLSKYLELEHKPQEYLNLCITLLESNSDIIFSRSMELNSGRLLTD